MTSAGYLAECGTEYPRMQTLSVPEILDGRRFNTPSVAARRKFPAGKPAPRRGVLIAPYDDHDLPPEGGYVRRRKRLAKLKLPPPTPPEDQLLYACLFAVALGFGMFLVMEALGLIREGVLWAGSRLWAWITS